MKKILIAVPALVVAAGVFGGTAAMASTTPPPNPSPFSLTVGPPKMNLTPGPGRMFVYNNGQKPVNIVMSAHSILRNTAGVCAADGTVTWVHTNPGTFTLPSHMYKYVKVTADPGKHPQTSLAIEATGAVPVPGQVHLKGTLVSKAVVAGPVAKNAPKPCVAITAPAKPSSLPIVPIGAGVVGLLVVGGAAYGIKRSGIRFHRVK